MSERLGRVNGWWAEEPGVRVEVFDTPNGYLQIKLVGTSESDRPTEATLVNYRRHQLERWLIEGNASDLLQATIRRLEMKAAWADDLWKHADDTMKCLTEYGPSIVAHLLDSDDNAGQRLRETLASRPS